VRVAVFVSGEGMRRRRPGCPGTMAETAKYRMLSPNVKQ